MHVVKLLHDLFDNACTSIDKRLRRALFDAVEALTRCKQLSIASIGRSLDRSAQIKHTIKCMDRLFGNQALHQKRNAIYNHMTKHLLKGNRKPVILVDWSGLTPCGAFHILNASIAIHGRSLTLYNEVFSQKEFTKEKTHLAFLRSLKEMLPENCTPIIVTDAGFRNTWFRAVSKMGWTFLGRVRNNTQYSWFGHSHWFPIKSLYEKATAKAEYIGRVLLARSSPLDCHFYIVKQKHKKRSKKNLMGKKAQSSVSKKHAKSANEPWLIASNLSPDEIFAENIINIYQKRMQIEELFRDLKNTRNGLGLRHCKSFTLERLNIALLIGTLAMLVLWIFGMAIKKTNSHHSFQSNTIRERNVLSVVIIGWQALMRKMKFRKKDCIASLEYIVSITISGVDYVK